VALDRRPRWLRLPYNGTEQQYIYDIYTVFSAKIAQALCILAMNIMDRKRGA
jgi:hypothetical protein